MMTHRLFLCAAFFGALFSPLSAAEAGATAAPAAEAKPAQTAPAATGFEQQFNELVSRIKAKLQTGVRTEEGLADELKQYDALLAAHAGEKSEDVAIAAYMRGTLYAGGLGDEAKGVGYLQQVEKDYPGTRAANGAAAVLAQITARKEAAKTKENLQPGKPFPDFEEKDLAGQPLSVSKYKGKIVLIDFWATWCGPCRAELPNVQAAYQKYHDKGFEIIGVSLDRDEKQLRDFLAEKKMTWSQYFDRDDKLAGKYGVNSIPATFLLDRDGNIIASDLRGEALDEKLASLLGK